MTAKTVSPWRRQAARAAAVLAAACALSWPALWAGYPQWYPDSVTYLGIGKWIWQRLLGDTAISGIVPRAELYCAGLYLLHWNVSPWPVVALNALLVAWTIWLVVRTLDVKRPVALYLGLIAGASLLTTVSWSVTLLSPDILGAVLYMAVYLLVFAGERLRRWETVSLFLLGSWLVTSHPTHMVLALGLCGVLGVLWLVRSGGLRGRGRMLLAATGMVALGCAMQTAGNARIFGKATLMDPQPPFLMARIIADGPSHLYLAYHCATLQWVICKHLNNLPWSEDDFLWKPGGIWQSASPEEGRALAAETMPLLIGTLRTYPRAQAKRSWYNFMLELQYFGIEDVTNANPWMIGIMSNVFPGARERFLRSEPRYDAPPRHLLNQIQERVVAVASVVCLLILPWAWRRGQLRLLGFSLVVAYVVIMNAMVTGVLSGQAPRYEGRVIWLVPVLAGLMVYVLVTSRVAKAPGPLGDPS